jgi:phosphoglycerate dehydrogenase-like enzyme
MDKKVLVSLKLEDRHRDLLKEAAGGRADLIFKEGSPVTEEELEGVHGIIGNIGPDLVQKAPDLEWMQLNSAGMDAYVKPGVLPAGCILKNAVGAYGLTVSEHMLALTLALLRKLELYHIDQMNHSWADEGNVSCVEGSTVLVLGLGDIGGSYARKMKALGAYVIGVRHSEHPKPDYVDEQYLFSALDSLLGRADIIASALPSTPETRHLLDEERLKQIKPSAILINCGRGDLIESSVLARALKDKTLAGAAVDVTDPEPLPKEHELWELSNCIITPHVAGGFHLQETFERIIRIAARNLDVWLSQE